MNESYVVVCTVFPSYYSIRPIHPAYTTQSCSANSTRHNTPNPTRMTGLNFSITERENANKCLHSEKALSNGEKKYIFVFSKPCVNFRCVRRPCSFGENRVGKSSLQKGGGILSLACDIASSTIRLVVV